MEPEGEQGRGVGGISPGEPQTDRARDAVRALLAATTRPATLTDACAFFMVDDGTRVPCVATVVTTRRGGGDPVLLHAGWGGGETTILTVSTLDKPASFCGTWSLPHLANDLERLGPALTSEIAERSALGQKSGWGIGSHTAGDVATAIAALWTQAGRPMLAPILSFIPKETTQLMGTSPSIPTPVVDVRSVRLSRVSLGGSR